MMTTLSHDTAAVRTAGAGPSGAVRLGYASPGTRRGRLARCRGVTTASPGHAHEGFRSTVYRPSPLHPRRTAMIWEGRQIAALDRHYDDDLLVRTPAGISRGNSAGKANTMATLTELSDRRLLGGKTSSGAGTRTRASCPPPHRLHRDAPRRHLRHGRGPAADVQDHRRHLLPRRSRVGRVAHP